MSVDRALIHLADPAIVGGGGGRKATWRSEEGDISVVVEMDVDGNATSVSAHRENASTRNIYYARCGTDLVVADNFHDVLASLPRAERRLDPDSVLAHLLFRTVPAERSYVPGVHRLGAGSSLAWRRDDGEVRVAQPSPVGVLPSRDYLRDIECALDEALGRVRQCSGVVNLLSGGVDSTLVQSFLGDAVPSMSAAIDSEEFADEVRYALAASKLLGSRHRLMECKESTWRHDVVEAIRAAALPPHHLQTALIHRAFDAEFDVFITAQYADALFGMGASAIVPDPRNFADRISEVYFKAAPSWAIPEHRRASAWVSRGSVLDPRGYGATFAMYTNLGPIQAHFGRDAVTRALEKRLEYTLSRIGHKVPKGLYGHLHVGHWVDYHCDDTLAIWRQLGFGRRKKLVAPFGTPSVARVAMSIPARDRYIRDGRTKYLLKDLLRKRLPAYDVDQPKGHSGLPLARFVSDGVIGSMLRDYGVPPELETLVRELESADRTHAHCDTWWNVASLVVWYWEVLKNADLRPNDGGVVRLPALPW